MSSPGLGRPLKKERDFARSIGAEVEIRTYRMVEGRKEFTGVLEEYDSESVTVSYEDGTKQNFDRKEIAHDQAGI